MAREKLVAHFEQVMNANYRLVAPPPRRHIAIGGYSKVASDDVHGEQFHNSNPVKHGHIILIVVILKQSRLKS